MRFKRPDHKNALSLIEAAEKKMNFTLKLELNEDSASTIASNIYECFRMLGDALYVKLGIQDASNKESVDELLELEVETTRPTNLIKTLKFLRHNINYYGYEPKLNEVADAINIAKACFNPLKEEVLKKITK